MKNKHLILKKSAPDTVEIGLGMEFHKRFDREKEPFSVSAEHAEMLLRSTDYFVESPDEEKTPPVKAAAKTTAKTSAEEKPAPVEISEAAAAKQEKIEAAIKT